MICSASIFLLLSLSSYTVRLFDLNTRETRYKNVSLVYQLFSQPTVLNYFYVDKSGLIAKCPFKWLWVRMYRNLRTSFYSNFVFQCCCYKSMLFIIFSGGYFLHLSSVPISNCIFLFIVVLINCS